MPGKQIPIKKENVKVEDGKVIIDSEELSNLIQNQDFDSMLEEEANSLINLNDNL